MSIHVNHVEIPRASIAREAQNHPAATPEAAWDSAARALAIRELLLQEARRLGLEPEPATDATGRETDEDALVRRLLERELRVPEADEAACRRYYVSNSKRFRSPDLYEAAHILFAARQDDEPAYARAVAEAEAAIEELTRRPERFADLARARSDCASGAEGGSLGQVTRGQTTPEFESVLLALEPGRLCRTPVRTRYGVHVVRLDRRIAGRALPFEAVKDRVAAYLAEKVWRRAVAQYVAVLAGRARIEGVAIAAAATPLVQ